MRLDIRLRSLLVRSVPKLIRDEFSGLAITRQRRWQLRKRRAGKCERCGGRKDKKDGVLCHVCQKAKTGARIGD
jgi:hypothetical protein